MLLVSRTERNLGRNGVFCRAGSSRSRRVLIRRVSCHWNCRITHGYIWILMFENVACIYGKMNLDKLWFSSGGVFSEQAGAHEAKMVSLVSQNIPGVHLDINIWKCCVYVWQNEFGQTVVFVGRGLLWADGCPWGENGVIGTAEHPRGTFGY